MNTEEKIRSLRFCLTCISNEKTEEENLHLGSGMKKVHQQQSGKDNLPKLLLIPYQIFSLRFAYIANCLTPAFQAHINIM